MGTKGAKPVPTFFRTAADFRRWLGRHHAKTPHLWVGYYKKATGITSIDWPQSRDQALCFGWIDGIRKTCDADSFMIRFTPRRAGSIWSAVNIARVRELTKEGLMMPAGTAAFERRDPKRSERYSFEQANIAFSPVQLRRLKGNQKAWVFFQHQPPSYRRMATWWVIDAKKQETRERRLGILIRDSSLGLRIAPLRRTEKKSYV